MNRSQQPKWYVYLALPLLVCLFLLESRLALPGLPRQLLQGAIVFFVFGLVYIYVTLASLRCCQDR